MKIKMKIVNIKKDDVYFSLLCAVRAVKCKNLARISSQMKSLYRAKKKEEENDEKKL